MVQLKPADNPATGLFARANTPPPAPGAPARPPAPEQRQVDQATPPSGGPKSPSSPDAHKTGPKIRRDGQNSPAMTSQQPKFKDMKSAKEIDWMRGAKDSLRLCGQVHRLLKISSVELGIDAATLGNRILHEYLMRPKVNGKLSMPKEMV